MTAGFLAFLLSLAASPGAAMPPFALVDAGPPGLQYRVTRSECGAVSKKDTDACAVRIEVLKDGRAIADAASRRLWAYSGFIKRTPERPHELSIYAAGAREEDEGSVSLSVREVKFEPTRSGLIISNWWAAPGEELTSQVDEVWVWTGEELVNVLSLKKESLDEVLEVAPEAFERGREGVGVMRWLPVGRRWSAQAFSWNEARRSFEQRPADVVSVVVGPFASERKAERFLEAADGECEALNALEKYFSSSFPGLAPSQVVLAAPTFSEESAKRRLKELAACKLTPAPRLAKLARTEGDPFAGKTDSELLGGLVDELMAVYEPVDPEGRPVGVDDQRNADLRHLFRALQCGPPVPVPPNRSARKKADIERLARGFPALIKGLERAASPQAFFARARLLEQAGGDELDQRVLDLYDEARSLASPLADYHEALYLMRFFPAKVGEAADADRFDRINTLLRSAVNRGDGKGEAAFFLSDRIGLELDEDGVLRRRDSAADQTEARRLACQSADAGDPRGAYRCAQYLLGELGPGAREPARGLKLLQTAAQAGVAEASFDLGKRYTEGQDAPRDAAKGKRWYCYSVLLGHPGAEAALKPAAKKR